MNLPALDVRLESELWRRLPEACAVARRAVAAAAAVIAFAKEDEIGVTLMDDTRIAELNRRWRHQDKPTNVLSFPAPPSPVVDAHRFLGDIVLAYETIEREARALRRTMDQHLAHLVLHGLLHLLGHDHESDERAEEMEELEARILATLGIADPHAVGAD